MPRKFTKKTASEVAKTTKSTPKVKKSSKQLKFTLPILVVLLFLISTLSLILVPKSLDNLAGQVILAGDQLQLESKNIKPVVAGISTVQNITKIIDHGKVPPKLPASAVLAQDLETGQLLFQKNIHARLSIASTTKIMTAVVGAEYYKSAQVLTVSKEDLVGGSLMGLSVGEQLSVRSLLYGMLLNSGNDAAFAIATNYPGGTAGFVAAMNKKATSLGLADTHFTNPAGFDSPDHYSSAFDLAKIAAVAADNNQLAKIVSTKETTVSSWDKARTHVLHNLNQLLSENGVMGIKTGTTDEAGPSLVGLVERDDHRVITVLLNSPSRFTETKLLMDWIYDNYSWTQETASR